MSWGSCASGSNNIHSDFPPIMSDGRNYASWQPGAVINQKIREENGIKSNFEYRSFMTKNADDIIAANQMEACNQCCSCPARPSQSTTPSTPFLYKSCTDDAKPFGYENSDLKEGYLSSYQLNCRILAPALSQDQYLKQQYPNFN